MLAVDYIVDRVSDRPFGSGSFTDIAGQFAGARMSETFARDSG